MTDELDLMDFNSEDDLQGYDYPAPGWFHLVVDDVDSSRQKVNGLKVTLRVMAGNVEGQVNKQFTETFFDPNPNGSDGGKFARKRLAKLALASGLIQPSALGSRVAIDWDALNGRQLVGKVGNYTRKDKQDESKVYKGAEIEGLHMYAVTDKEVAQIPKDPQLLAMLGLAPQPVAAPQANGNGHAAPAQQQAAPVQQPVQQQAQVAQHQAVAAQAADPYAGL